ncbi:CAP domain-containing protein [Piscinibacter sp.]|uniref:CAP domain-containing protein n=1 Tax=Piscinibacter sp. TaxID=1903157 RepID=UPI002F405BF3
MQRLSCVMGIAAACWLAACGGVAGTASAGPRTAAPAPPSGANCGLDDLAPRAIERLNRLRASGANCRSAGRFAPAGPLAWNDTLARAAAVHSRDMASHRHFAHTGSDGRTLRQRIDASGYRWRRIGENIAAGEVGVDAVVDGWMASDVHCANIMNPDFSEVGLVCVPARAGDEFPTYWTLDLARPR